MPVMLEKRHKVCNRQKNAENTKRTVSSTGALNGKSNGKRNKKSQKYKLRKHYVSMTSIIQLESEDINLNSLKRTDSDRSMCTKLPVLHTRSPTPLSLPPSRLANPLPQHLIPGAHERRKKLPILSAIKPENERSERERFMRANYNYNPLFLYRFPADLDILERMGKPSDKYMTQAILIMENAIDNYGTYEKFEEETGGKILGRSQIMAIIQQYLRRENLEREIGVNLSEEILSRGSMTRVRGKAMLNVRIINLRENWVEGLLRHEIGTHYLRTCNNKEYPWNNWKIRKDMGLMNFNPTEEGLASLHSVLFRKDPCLWRAALLYYTAYKAAFLSFKELFRDLGRFVSDPNVRWDYCIRAKRGQKDTSMSGAFCKDQVYLEGALQILKHRKILDFHLLVRLGKIAFEDINMLKDYTDVKNTRIPFFMEDLNTYHKLLDRIAEANALTDDVLREV
ncbi:hypothetical protein ACJMK2_010106 [Sinanodonta woodiana]|uniref:KIAA0895 n=1 Tax=Sinanodonta woodiana TaxID=1069815 RepID=A0ABD3VFX2_SINWO